MSGLKQLQEQFQDFVLKDRREFTAQVSKLDKTTGEAGLNVYQNGYYLRLLEILEYDYPKLRKMVGDDTFYKWGRAYIRAYPSHRFSVRHFGIHFETFLKTHSEAEPIHAEMAQFEWYLEVVMDTKDAPHLSMEDLAKIQPEKWIDIQFTVHPSVANIQLYSNAPMIWAAYNEEKEIPSVQFSDSPIQWIFWRHDLRGFYQSLDENQYLMFQALQNGQSFGDICEALCEVMEPDEVAQFAGLTLRNWIADGIISTVENA